ncbi:hypothetical protein DL762_001554 [Monosporascus cannonballus]|uniref:Uncharacterized protein n=1 Tax=Monosporascus cannonballus TaxID=155416 RepID=A0ABY0HK86_9PEZI|nr:hypothetical protein DL762_001554 [Monosporascus cannonballus]RYO94639.1 hypothetical protein DL763_004006 [Monosporascus cannonballus]
MPMIRIPFTNRRLNVAEAQDENERPGMPASKDSHSGFERVEIMGSKASSALSIRSSKSQDNGDYKMSAIAHRGKGSLAKTINVGLEILSRYAQ